MNISLFDTHAHYNDEKFNEDREDVLQKVYDSGVTKLVNAGYSLASSKKAIQIAQNYSWMYVICGISPNDIPTTIKEIDYEIEQLEQLIENSTKKEFVDTVDNKQEEQVNVGDKTSKKIVAIGEIGLDYYWNTENKELQQYAFEKQIELANKLELPIVIHTREAVDDTLAILRKNNVIKKGIFHCCTLNRNLVKQALELGFYISFAGPITFKNSKNAEEIISMVPLDKILIETDSPYLSPEPNRGKRNDSRNVRYIAQKIADVKNMPLEQIAEYTYDNAMNIYGINRKF